MSHFVIFRMINGDNEIVSLQYLCSEDSLFPEWSNWRWRNYKDLAFHFSTEEEAKQLVKSLGERHALIVPIGHLKQKENKIEVPSDQVYRETCKRLGERDDS